jgi:hypothetical protein
VAAKIIVQWLRQCQDRWDKCVPQNIHTAWYDLKDQLPILNDLTYPGKVVIKNATWIKIHEFCDASKRA